MIKKKKFIEHNYTKLEQHKNEVKNEFNEYQNLVYNTKKNKNQFEIDLCLASQNDNNKNDTDNMTELIVSYKLT